MSKYIAKYEKQPSEVLPYVYTPQDDLESGDTISTATLTIVDAATGDIGIAGAQCGHRRDRRRQRASRSSS